MTAKRRKRKSPVALLLIFTALAVFFAFRAPDLIRRIQYPTSYRELVCEVAGKYQLPEALVAAMMYTESHYNPSARSSSGALGLMQIMPDTGEWIAGKLGVGFSPEYLLTAEFNAEFGAWYMRFLLDRYSGRVGAAVAAYHAGQGRVDDWLRDTEFSPDGITLVRAGSDATQHYINKVMNAYENYQILYSGD